MSLNNIATASIPRRSWLVVTMSLVLCITGSGRRALFAHASAAFVAAPSRLARTTAAATTTTNLRFASSQSESRATTSRRSTVRNESDVSTNKKAITTKTTTASSTTPSPQDAKLLNLSTVTQEDLHTIVVDGWGHPKFRVKQVWNWIREQGVTDVDQMTNLPVALRDQLNQFSVQAALTLAEEQISSDGTIKRAYMCADGQVIESVLMPYSDGRYTACISSQAGCAQGCVFCATGQMGFSRQLTPDEIFEQVSRFAAELKQQDKMAAAAVNDANASYLDKDGQKQQHGKSKRLSNVVFMGMGEPLANYRNVVTAINRMTGELGIGARKITVSTVGIVPNIRKLTHDVNVPQIRLAVSLHCATDEERTALLPANRRYGGLDELMSALKEYIDTTGRRLTLEWALISGENDGVETARQLGKLIHRSGLRRDMVHVNVIPLNPTGGFAGGPSGRQRVNAFVQALEKDYGIACTPRVRRGIDIDAGCGQLKSAVLDKKPRQIGGPKVNDVSDIGAMEGDLDANQPFAVIDVPAVKPQQPKTPSLITQSPRVGVYEDEEDDDDDEGFFLHDFDSDKDNDEAMFLEDFDSDEDDEEEKFEVQKSKDGATTAPTEAVVLNDEYLLDESLTVDFESDDYEDPEFDQDWQKQEASRLISLVKGTTVASSKDDSSVSSGAASKVAAPSKKKIAAPSKKKKKRPLKEQEASRLIGLVKGTAMAASSKDESSSVSGAASKIAAPSTKKRP